MVSKKPHHGRTSPKEYKGADQEFLAAFGRAKMANPDLQLTNRQYRRFLQKRGRAFAARKGVA